MDILIVESAAKARTLGRYLGKGWKVLATGGHVQTLPNDRKLHGKDGKKAYWASAEGALPSPPWVWTDRGEKAVQAIIDAAGEDKATFWLAPDPDREGEFIAWRLEELLAPHGTTHRVTFHEVTADAVRAAVDAPRTVDMKMVESALVRKFLDRLVGFRTSKLARGMLRGGSASMGRVQTPALGFVVERELEREAHVPIPYFEVRATAAGIVFQVRFSERNAPDVWRDEADRAHPNRTHDRDAAQTALHHLTHAEQLTVLDAATRNRNLKPKPPFTTDALLQAGGSRFGWTPRKTSALASMLYEAGHITYMRTDGLDMAPEAVAAARATIESRYGKGYL
ncbi:MAG: DNA topoisomerase, partial [Myxococcota bacterium]